MDGAPDAVEHRRATLRAAGDGGDAARPGRSRRVPSGWPAATAAAGGSRRRCSRWRRPWPLPRRPRGPRRPPTRPAGSSRTPNRPGRRPGTDFVVVMAPDRTRFSHPTRSQIGEPFVGDDRARPGRPRRSPTTNVGTLGDSVRAVVPVYDERRRIVGLVSVGITTRAITASCSAQLPVLLGVAAPALRARRDRHLAAQPPAAPPDARAGPGRDDPDVRVLRRGPARGARRPASCSTATAGSRWSTTRAAGCSGSTRTRQWSTAGRRARPAARAGRAARLRARCPRRADPRR